jgi:hypothetical protein
MEGLPVIPVVKISLTPESQAAIATAGDGLAKLGGNMARTLRAGLAAAEGTLKSSYLRGGSLKSSRGGQAPLAVRSGALIAAATSGLDSRNALSGYVGVIEGTATKYAAVLLGSGETTIKPKNAKHLWIPVGDNLNPSGIARISPREAMGLRDEEGKPALRFIHRGSTTLVGTTEKVPGKRKTKVKLRILFVLKDQVTVKGTDALAMAVEDTLPEITESLGATVAAFVNGGAA